MTSEIGGIKLHFGNVHDSRIGRETIEATPQNRVLIMDRGFSSLSRIAKLLQEKDRYFLMRVNSNIILDAGYEGIYKLGKTERIEARVIIFRDENNSEYRLVTNLPSSGENNFTEEDIKELYRRRWQIELLWKFLKMHLKLDRIITKNVNGIEIQVYASLIAYLFLQLLEVASFIGNKPLDKLHYLLAFMKSETNFIRWFDKLALTN